MNPDQNRDTNRLVVPLIIAVTLGLIAAVGAGYFFTQYSDQKNNTDAKIAAAVEAANEQLRTDLSAEFEEKNKSPFDTYISSEQTGNVSLTYPRTWSAYVEESSGSSASFQAYFYPEFVPGNNQQDTNYVLRASVESDDYASEVESYQDEVEDGGLKARSITVSGIKGVRFDGTLEREKQGAIILLPLRDKTIKVWTESPQYLNDFNKTIIANLSFKP